MKYKLILVFSLVLCFSILLSACVNNINTDTSNKEKETMESSVDSSLNTDNTNTGSINIDNANTDEKNDEDDDKFDYVETIVSDHALDLYGFATKKGDTQLMDEINKVINSWIANGMLDKYINYYKSFENSEPSSDDLKLSWDLTGTNGKISVYIEPSFFPFLFYNEGEFIGIDIAIMSQVAENLGKSLEIHKVPFNTILEHVNSCDGDAVAASGISITEARKEQVDFSTPYCASFVSIVSDKKNVFSSISEFERATKIGYITGTNLEYIMKEAVETGIYNNTNIHLTPGKLELEGFYGYYGALAALKNGEIDAFVHSMSLITP